jgi:hypothetical protein
LVVSVTDTFLVWLVTVTFAPDTAAPDGSDTVPRMLPYTACPTAAGTQRPHSRLNVASATNTVLLMDILLNLRNAIAPEMQRDT